MKRLYIMWVFGVLALILFSIIFSGESTSFYGITETREIIINSEYSVQIEKIHVVQGQSVERGDTLVELESPELAVKISKLRAEKTAKIIELKARIRELEAQYKLNRQLTSELRSIEGDRQVNKNRTGNNPLEIRIASLKRELDLIQHPSTANTKGTSLGNYSSAGRTKAQTKVLAYQLKLLELEKSKLTIYAQIDGIIGSVDFKAKEKVSPFTPILTLHTKSPSYVKGYVHENVYNKVSIGEKLSIVSLADKRVNVTGKVVGVGSRIVEYPIRLRKRPDIQIWGREIVIKIPCDNSFLLGEKILISSVSVDRNPLSGLWGLFSD